MHDAYTATTFLRHNRPLRGLLIDDQPWFVAHDLARRATAQEYLKTWEAYLRMAMKAQNQCRMTLETLAMIKNPPTVFAKQANINHGGQQQVNNGAAPPAPR